MESDFYSLESQKFREKYSEYFGYLWEKFRGVENRRTKVRTESENLRNFFDVPDCFISCANKYRWFTFRVRPPIKKEFEAEIIRGTVAFIARVMECDGVHINLEHPAFDDFCKEPVFRYVWSEFVNCREKFIANNIYSGPHARSR